MNNREEYNHALIDSLIGTVVNYKGDDWLLKVHLPTYHYVYLTHPEYGETMVHCQTMEALIKYDKAMKEMKQRATNIGDL